MVVKSTWPLMRHRCAPKGIWHLKSDTFRVNSCIILISGKSSTLRSRRQFGRQLRRENRKTAFGHPGHVVTHSKQKHDIATGSLPHIDEKNNTCHISEQQQGREKGKNLCDLHPENFLRHCVGTQHTISLHYDRASVKRCTR